MNFLATFTTNRVLFTTLISLLTLFLPLRSYADGERAGLKVVVIDAGHGGAKFPGASYGGHYEKNINLQVALKLGALIEKEMPDVKVVYTRKSDKQFSADLNVDLQARADIANKANGDLFISIHANAARSTAARGVETLIMGESERETRNNEAVLYANNKEEFLDMSDERTAAIVRAYIQNLQFTYGEYSEAMARITQRCYEAAGYHSRGVKRQPLKVLYATDMPSILTEIGFMSNSAELKYMTSERGQNAIARALLNAVKEYDSYVRRSSLASVETEKESPKPPVIAPTVEEKPSEEVVTTTPQSGYTVQIMASPTPIALNSSSFKSYRGEVKQYRAGGKFSYKYCVGCYNTRGEAAAAQKRVRREFKDAFVVHFVGDRIE